VDFTLTSRKGGTDKIMIKEINKIKTAICVCFFISGMCGLIYEILWLRMLTLVFGCTLFAVSTVLTVFMGGLALGSLLIGRYIDKWKNVLFIYGLVEVGIGLYCLFIPSLFDIVKLLYIAFYKTFPLSFHFSTFVRFLLCSFTILLPTVFMGSTLPILCKFFIKELPSSESDSKVGKKVGFLYAINTLGAVLGTVIAGFLLLQILGIKILNYSAVAMNIGVGLLCISFSQRIKDYLIVVSPENNSSNDSPSNQNFNNEVRVRENLDINGRALCIFILIGLGLCGFSSMIYEVVWTRVLCLIIGSSVYAFSTMLTTFIFGIGLGSLLFSWLWKDRPVKLVLFGIVELGIGLYSLLLIYCFEKLPFFFLGLFSLTPLSFGIPIWIQFLICFLVMLIPTILMGASFPIASQIYTRSLERVGKSIGTLYFSDTIGCIFGSSLAGFLFIPVIGTQNTIFFAVFINIMLGLVAILFFRRLGQKVMMISLALGAILALFYITPGWNKQVMNSGASIYATRGMKRFVFKELLEDSDIVYYKEGIDSTVSVHRTPDGIHMKTNGKIEGGTGRDMRTQLLLGYLPVLLHKDPKNILIIGCGTGITAGAVAQCRVKSIDLVELEEGVIEGAKFFKGVNRNVLEDRKLNAIINDGRNHLLITPKVYDVIMSAPSYIWTAGVANLFTEEFYKLCKEKLSKDGIMAQWVQIYGMSYYDVRTIIKTFTNVFKHTTLCFSSLGDIILIGAKEEQNVDYLKFKEHFLSNPLIKEDLEKIKVNSPLSLLTSSFLLNKDEVEKYLEGFKRVNTDDLQCLEFSAPKNIYRESARFNFMKLCEFRRGRFPNILFNIEETALNDPALYYDTGVVYNEIGLGRNAFDEFDKAKNLDPQYIPAYIEIAKIYSKRRFSAKAISELKRALLISPNSSEVYYELGKIYHNQNMLKEAILSYKKAISMKPTDSNIYLSLASALLSKKNVKEASFCYKKALSITPEDISVMTAVASFYYDQKLYKEAIDMCKRILEINPLHIPSYAILGEMYFDLEDYRKAEKMFKKVLKYNPQNIDARLNIGACYANLGERKRAKEEFRKILSIDPLHFNAQHNLELLE